VFGEGRGRNRAVSNSKGRDTGHRGGTNLRYRFEDREEMRLFSKLDGKRGVGGQSQCRQGVTHRPPVEEGKENVAEIERRKETRKIGGRVGCVLVNDKKFRVRDIFSQGGKNIGGGSGENQNEKDEEINLKRRNRHSSSSWAEEGLPSFSPSDGRKGGL